MDKTKIFPTVLIILDICAAAAYIGTDFRKVIYWMAAAILTMAVTF